MIMKKNVILLSFMAITLFMTSCVSKKDLEKCQAELNDCRTGSKDLMAKYMDVKEQLAASRSEAAGLKSSNQELKNSNDVLRSSYESLQGSLNQSLQSNTQTSVNISKLVDEINASNAFIKRLVEAKTKSDSLNMALTNKLTRSLDKEELKEVDVQVLKGVVYISLADNMLYKLGSYEINDRAAETLSKIAKIIMDYEDYDVLIEGNTDNLPISRTNIRNNWDLSCLRASSVVQYLQKHYGVDPKRLTAGGRGEYNPLAKNDTEVGRQRNRRTQIIITPKLDQFMDLIDKAPENEEK